MVTTVEGIELGDFIRDDRVVGRIYTDPEVFDLEMDKIFRRSWSFICHETQVSEPGDYFSTFIGREPVIVARGADDGQVHIFYNRCRHRGNIVCQYEQGNASYFRCAYHGWTFNNQGRLIGVPFKQAYGGRLDFAELGLVEVAQVANYKGFVFACQDPTAIPFEEYLGEAHTYLDEFAAQGPAGVEFKAGVQKVMYRGNWKFQNENDADNYHFDFTHQLHGSLGSKRAEAHGGAVKRMMQPPGSIVRALGHGHSANHRYSSVGGGGLYEQARAHSQARLHLEALERKIGVEAAKDLLSKCHNPPHTFRMFPNIVIIGVQVRRTLPLTVDTSENDYWPSLLKGVPEEVNAIRLRLHEQSFGPAGFTSPDDVEVFARNQIGMQARANDWQIMARGYGREQFDEHGVAFGDVKDETGMRGIYQEWKRLMTRP